MCSFLQGNNGQILSFGGVDRTQEHFSDLLVGTCNTSSLNDITFEVKECSGDIPTSRSGHSVVTYGRFMILFGGIDFTEEAVYNDLYLLDTGSPLNYLAYSPRLYFFHFRYMGMELHWRKRS